MESLVFFLAWEALKDRREVDATLIVCGHMRLSTEKGTKAAGNLLHVSSFWASNIIHTERLKHSWLNNTPNIAFLFLSYFDYVMLTYERYQALHAIHIRVPGEPGNEASNLYVISHCMNLRRRKNGWLDLCGKYFSCLSCRQETMVL